MNRYYESARIASLLARYALHTINPDEKRELSARLSQNGINPEKIIRNVTDMIPSKEETEAQERVLELVKREIETKRRKTVLHKRFSMLPYAAAIIILITVSLVLFYDNAKQVTIIEPIKMFADKTVLEYPSGEKVEINGSTKISDILKKTKNVNKNELINNLGKQANKQAAVEAPLFKIRVSRGATHTVILDDGTKVILYPESELTFPEYFGNKERNVSLTGEGYFDVHKDAARPFTVKTADASVTVLGTSFNIRAYENEPTNETVLVTGKVLLNNTELYPDQIAVVDKSSKHINIQAIDANIYKERAEGLFVFENRSLYEIMREFSLWYGFEYNFDSEALKDKKFRLKLPRSEDLMMLLNLMEKTGELKFTINDNKLEIKTTH
jgi:hypothetical protein